MPSQLILIEPDGEYPKLVTSGTLAPGMIYFQVHFSCEVSASPHTLALPSLPLQ